LREERVQRDPVLCEPLNEDVGFFVDPNLRIKSCVSCVLLHLLILPSFVYLLMENIMFRSLLLSISSSVDLARNYSNCFLVGRLSNSAFYNPALL
jgi:hypothetical protein